MVRPICPLCNKLIEWNEYSTGPDPPMYSKTWEGKECHVNCWYEAFGAFIEANPIGVFPSKAGDKNDKV